MSGEFVVRPGDEVLIKDYIWGCEEPDDAQAVRLHHMSERWYPVVRVAEMKHRAWVMVRNSCNRCWWIELTDVVEARRRFVPSGVAEGESP